MTDRITLTAVGDISFGDNAICVGHGVRSRFERQEASEPLYPFTHVAPFLEEADLVFGNLETVLSDSGRVEGRLDSLQMRGHPAGVARLAKAGFSLINVANNHMLQHGAAAFSQTVESLESAGLRVIGLADGGRRSCLRKMVDVRGIRVAFLGYAFEPDRYFNGPPLYAFGPDADIAGDIADARAAADLVVCSVHWGDEFVRYPSPEEVALGRSMIDAGAHLVLGHHPHVLRGFERYNGGVVVYSLGNFVFDMLWDEHLRRTAMLTLTLTRDGVVEVQPRFCWIGEDYQPAPLAGDELRRADEAWDEAVAWAARGCSPDQYQQDRSRTARVNRHQSWLYFSRHLLHRRPRITAQVLARTAQRKVMSTLGTE
jgi:poly-gamma-glutamate synthesis protein (capsule biosynthesis protein)